MAFIAVHSTYGLSPFTTPMPYRRQKNGTKHNNRAFATPIAGRLLLTVNFLPPSIPRRKGKGRKEENGTHETKYAVKLDTS